MENKFISELNNCFLCIHLKIIQKYFYFKCLFLLSCTKIFLLFWGNNRKIFKLLVISSCEMPRMSWGLRIQKLGIQCFSYLSLAGVSCPKSCGCVVGKPPGTHGSRYSACVSFTGFCARVILVMSVCCKAWWLEFYPWNPHVKGKNLVLQLVLWSPHAQCGLWVQKSFLASNKEPEDVTQSLVYSENVEV